MFARHMQPGPRKWALIAVSVLIVIGAVLLAWQVLSGKAQRQVFEPTNQQAQSGIVDLAEDVAVKNIEVVAENLEIPWGIAFLPNGELLVTERPGRLVHIGADKVVIPVEGVEHIGEGGLLGIALHPNFAQNNFIYLYLTTQTENGLINRVDRYEFADNKLANKNTVIDNIPGARFHDGGQIKFGPDGYLYITVGDAGDEDAAQDLNKLNGKILRIDDGGGIPPDNPFATAVYSYGHRNPQGLTWDDQGNLWATEHGRSGIKSGLDELNLIESGRNYGWPVIQGDETDADMVRPAIHSGGDTTWAPAGAAFVNGSVFFGGLRGESLYQVSIATNEVDNLLAHFTEKYGRIRAVELGPDGLLYISTSNRDGRGEAQAGDDKVIRINPDIFK